MIYVNWAQPGPLGPNKWISSSPMLDIVFCVLEVVV